MADRILSVVATVGSKLPNLPIKDAQLIFVKDRQKIALDSNGKRTFYSQITELESEAERQSLLAPITGHYYFVIETAVMWTYNGDWIQLTYPPQDIVCIGTQLPELGKAQTLYVNKTEQNISVWDEENNSYMVVGEKYDRISNSDIDSLFKQN